MADLLVRGDGKGSYEPVPGADDAEEYRGALANGIDQFGKCDSDALISSQGVEMQQLASNAHRNGSGREGPGSAYPPSQVGRGGDTGKAKLFEKSDDSGIEDSPESVTMRRPGRCWPVSPRCKKILILGTIAYVAAVALFLLRVIAAVYSPASTHGADAHKFTIMPVAGNTTGAPGTLPDMPLAMS